MTTEPTTTEAAVEAPPRRRDPARRVLQVLGLGLLLVVGSFGLTGSAAGAADHSGNWCQANASRFWTNNAGNTAQACVRANGSSRSWVNITPAAVDTRADGLSAASHGAIEQWVGGRWVDTGAWRVVNSRGYGWSVSGVARYVDRLPGATHFRTRVVACTQNGANGTPTSCSAPARSQAFAW